MKKEALIEMLISLPAGADVRFNVYEHDYTHARTASTIRRVEKQWVEPAGFRGTSDRIFAPDNREVTQSDIEERGLVPIFVIE